ncbi:unnamed protein product [Arabidopsis halleri]
MAKPFDKKFGWVIKDFSSLQPDKCYSVPFLISDSKWRLIAFPKGNNSDYLSLYLEVYEAESLPSCKPPLEYSKSIFAKALHIERLNFTNLCSLVDYNFLNSPSSVFMNLVLLSLFGLKLAGETEHCFDFKSTTWGFRAMLSLSKLHEKDGGFLVSG